MGNDQATRPKEIYRVQVSRGNETQMAYVELEKFTVGSLPNLAIVIHDPTIDKKHLMVSSVDHRIWLTDLGSSTGTRVNGFPIRPNIPFEYKPGDRITLGRSDFSLRVFIFVPQGRDVETDALMEQVKAKAEAQADQLLQAAHREIAGHKAEWERQRLESQASSEQAISDARLRAEEILQQAKTDLPILKRKLVEEIRPEVETGLREELRSRILREAHKEAEQVLHAARLRAASEYNQQVADLLSSAHRQAEEASEVAFQESARRSDEVYAETYKRAEVILDESKGQAEQLLKSAQAHASQLKTQAFAEANQLMAQARRTEAAIRDKARSEAENLLAQTRQRCDEMHHSQEQQNLRLLELARHAEQTLMAQVETEIEERRGRLETELERMRQMETDRLAQQWKHQGELTQRMPNEAKSLLVRELPIEDVEEPNRDSQSLWGKLLFFRKKANDPSETHEASEEKTSPKISMVSSWIMFAFLMGVPVLLYLSKMIA